MTSPSSNSDITYMAPTIQLRVLITLVTVILALSAVSINATENMSPRFTYDKWHLNLSAESYAAESDTSPTNAFSKQPSPNTALRYSMAATIIPITVGTLIWSLHGPEKIVLNAPGGGTFTVDGLEPDRTLPGMLIWGGATIGPSFGYFYGGKPWRGLGGIALRNGLMIGGTLGAILICPLDCKESSAELNLAGIAFFGSIAVAIGSSIHDLATVKGSVRKENAKREGKFFSVRPWLSNNFRPQGLSLSLSF